MIARDSGPPASLTNSHSQRFTHAQSEPHTDSQSKSHSNSDRHPNANTQPNAHPGSCPGKVQQHYRCRNAEPLV